uniref:Uncharacterized protein n=1 Tax=Acrobeloides nanus TaxID=290746 RepID=A0A914C9E6_9BILA
MVNLVAESEVREKAEFIRLYPNSKYVEIISLILMIPSSLLFVAFLMISAFVAVIYHDHCITAPVLPVWLFIFSIYFVLK